MSRALEADWLFGHETAEQPNMIPAIELIVSVAPLAESIARSIGCAFAYLTGFALCRSTASSQPGGAEQRADETLLATAPKPESAARLWNVWSIGLTYVDGTANDESKWTSSCRRMNR